MVRKVGFQLTFFVAFLAFTGNVFSQYESRGEKYNKKDAETFYKTGNFYDALPLFETLLKQNPEENEYQLKIGICHIYLNKTPEKAIEYLEKVAKNNAETKNVYYYLARAYALNYKFTKAIETYKKAEALSTTEPNLVTRIPLLISQCNNGIQLVQDSLAVEITNLGESINTSANEYSPTINEDETMLFFTYRGENSIGGRVNTTNKPKSNGNFNEDIYMSSLNNDVWSQPKSISDSVNTKLDEASISIAENGEKLYLYKDTPKAKGDIFESIKEENSWSEPKRLSFNSKFWEGHATVSKDGKKIIFSSDRPVGIGGKDLYSAQLQEDGTWGNVKNLGPTINTIYDEDSPFLHADGNLLNFSSEGHSSIGGYDIFESKIINDSSYSEPVNIGYPINTTADDIFFTVLPNDNVYFSSARKGGYGQNDIYFIKVKGLNISGVARSGDDAQTVMSNTIVNITNKDKTFNLTDTTDAEGNFIFAKLPSENDYVLFVQEKNQKEITSTSYTLAGNVTKMGRAYNKNKVNEIATDEKGFYKLEFEKTYKEESSLLPFMSEEDVLLEFGDKTAPGLIYKVQIAALTNVENFEEKDYQSLGNIESIELDDDLTRFMVGNFETLEQANKLLIEAKKIGDSADAFIIVFVDGKRTYLENLINDGAFEEK